MVRHFSFIAAAILIAGHLPVSAAEIRVASRVDAVTVFPSGAEIARRLDVTADPGSHVLILADLPAALDPNSIRVDGEATAALEITSLDARRVLVRRQGSDAGMDASERKRIEDEILRLTDERAGLDGAIAAAEGQKALAENLSRLPLAAAKVGEAQMAATPDWNAIFDLIGARLEGAAKAIQDAHVAQRGLDERIALLKEQLQREPAEEQERTELRIFADARTAVKGALRVRYQVASAEWSAIYDARLTTGGKDGASALALARRASISQSTGEDWNEAKLTLSTARPDGATAAPDLAAMKVLFKPELRPLSKSADGAARRLEAPGAGSLAAAPDPEAVTEREAEVESAPYQAAFALPQRVTIKSGVGEKTLLISSDELKPSLYVLAVPKLDAKAYLHAKFTHDGVAPLLPGAVSLYRDGVYIGQGRLPLTVRGEEKELGFGPDDAVTVARVELKRAKGESGIISSSTTDEQHFRITVKNLHGWPVPVTVVDQMPVSEDEQIAVDLLPMTSEPSERNFDDKLGVLAWMFDLPAQGEKEIALSYEVKWPAKREVIVSEY